MSSINVRLRDIRKHAQASQEEFGTTGGISQSTQNRYEQEGTEIPISYLNKIFHTYGEKVHERWFYFGKGDMLKEETPPLTTDITQPSHQEAQIIDEVTQFSNFLKQRALPLKVKRRLLELLIESIDQALTTLDHKDQNSE